MDVIPKFKPGFYQIYTRMIRHINKYVFVKTQMVSGAYAFDVTKLSTEAL